MLEREGSRIHEKALSEIQNHRSLTEGKSKSDAEGENMKLVSYFV